MLKEKNKLIIRVHIVIDLFITTIAFISAYFSKKFLLPDNLIGLTTVPNYYAILFIIIIIWYLVFKSFGLYESYRQKNFRKICLETAKAVSICMVSLFLTMYLLKIFDVSRIMLGIFYFLDIALLCLCKGFVFHTLVRLRTKGYNFRNILIVGTKERARDVIRAIRDKIGSGYRLLGCLDLDNLLVSQAVMPGVMVIGTINDLQQVLEREVVDEIIFAMPLKKIDEASKYIVIAEEFGVAVRIIPDWQLHHLMYRPGKAKIRFEDFLGIPTMSLETTPPDKGALLVKEIIDYTVGALLIVLCLPLFVIVALAIKIASPGGPVFFKQERFGLQGRRFNVYKFRTMIPEAEKHRECLQCQNEADGPVFKIRNDPRIIPWVGHFLRKTSLDELPQLINVLRGEMSLVGPRPPIPSEVDHYEVWQRRRLSMKPGLTCIWQVSPKRNDVSFADWMKMDLSYIDNWSLLLDFKIIARTALVVLTGHGR